MANNKIKGPDHQEVSIVDRNGAAVGRIRVKPNAILWAPKNAKGAKPWFKISLDDFAKHIEELNNKVAN